MKRILAGIAASAIALGATSALAQSQTKAPPKIVFIAVGLVLLACLAWGAWSHWLSYSESKQTASDTVNRPVEVRTLAAQREDAPMDLTLPGETDAFDTASLFARLPCGDSIELGHFQVGEDFTLQLPIETPLPKQRQQTSRCESKLHDSAPRNRATSAVALSQFATATRSCFDPALVSE